MAAEGLLRRNPDPSFEEIRLGMSGNLCRCGAYAHIFKSVAAAAKRRNG
jgi:xanthine dehydrogenase YagT iron-sulfur-binding subunit